MQETALHNGPIVIGGVGGSGTRVIAEILQTLGFYMGADLNTPKDNLWFTLLFKRPRWLNRVRENEAEIFRHLDIFTHAMHGKRIYAPGDVARILYAASRMAVGGHARHMAGAGVWPFARAASLMLHGKTSEECLGWGWKEPNTHVYLPWLARYYAPQSFRYILTMRHGIDMAFSANLQQVYNWHWLYDLPLPTKPEEIPVTALAYWVRANRVACEYGKTLGEKAFLCLNFDALCADPITAVETIVRFLDLDPSPDAFAAACALPRKPSTIGRYKTCDYSRCAPEDIEAVKEFGFTVEQSA